jgi:hypothetical protein
MISSVTSGASAALLLLAGLPSVVAQSPYSVDSRGEPGSSQLPSTLG